MTDRDILDLNGELDEGDGIGYGGEEEYQEVIEGSISYKEHAFTFATFESVRSLSLLD